MKPPFLLFGGSDEFRFGGWQDFLAYCDSVDDARQRIKEMKLIWYQVVGPDPDIRSMTILFSKPKHEGGLISG